MSEEKFVRFWIMWRHNGQNCWEACGEEEAMPLIRRLVEKDGVNPASIFFATDCKWMCPTFHGGKKTIWPRDFIKELEVGAEVKDQYTGPNVQPEKKPPETLYGFISPDGRYFPCPYGGHSELARKIVGSLQEIKDPHKYLEDHGWLVIYNDPIKNNEYAVGTGIKGRITDDQIRAMERIGLPTTTRGVAELLERSAKS